jgi:hypothetical protein
MPVVCSKVCVQKMQTSNPGNCAWVNRVIKLKTKEHYSVLLQNEKNM